MATDTQRPVRFKVFWRQRKRPPSILSWPVSVFQYLEWLIEWVDYALKRMAFFDVLGRVSQLSILVLVIGYFLGRGEAAENARKQTQYQAWQVVNSALAAGGSGGRVDALQDIHRTGGSLKNVRLTGAVIDSLDLSPINGRRAVLFGARLDSTSLRGARFTGANLGTADLTGATLTGADLTGADLDSAILTHADFTHADLADADFDKADLTSAIFTNANLTHAILNRADLTGADLYGAGLSAASLYHAILTNADLTRADLVWASLENADLTGAILTIANLNRANLYHADLTRADLTGAHLADVSSTGTQLRTANLFRVVDPPDDFIQEAIRDGAVCVEDPDEWLAIQSGEREPPDTPQDAAAFERECQIQRRATDGPEGSRP